jgi:hypothetical protein
MGKDGYKRRGHKAAAARWVDEKVATGTEIVASGQLQVGTETVTEEAELQRILELIEEFEANERKKKQQAALDQVGTGTGTVATGPAPVGAEKVTEEAQLLSTALKLNAQEVNERKEKPQAALKVTELPMQKALMTSLEKPQQRQQATQIEKVQLEKAMKFGSTGSTGTPGNTVATRPTEAPIAQLDPRQEVPFGKMLVQPSPRFVVKTHRRLLTSKKKEKMFINIVAVDELGKPFSTSVSPSPSSSSSSAAVWTIPNVLGPPRQEPDKGGAYTLTFDFAVHTDACSLATKDEAFKETVVLLALEEVRKYWKDNEKKPLMLVTDKEGTTPSYIILFGCRYKTGRVLVTMLVDKEPIEREKKQQAALVQVATGTDTVATGPVQVGAETATGKAQLLTTALELNAPEANEQKEKQQAVLEQIPTLPSGLSALAAGSFVKLDTILSDHGMATGATGDTGVTGEPGVSGGTKATFTSSSIGSSPRPGCSVLRLRGGGDTGDDDQQSNNDPNLTEEEAQALQDDALYYYLKYGDEVPEVASQGLGEAMEADSEEETVKPEGEGAPRDKELERQQRNRRHSEFRKRLKEITELKSQFTKGNNECFGTCTLTLLILIAPLYSNVLFLISLLTYPPHNNTYTHAGEYQN